MNAREDIRPNTGEAGRDPAKGMPDAARKYQPYPTVGLTDRTWPSKVIDTAPIWCSVDLRDGNQALIDPMGHERKARMFALLLDMGFKEIEIGFPSASQTDFDFARWCIEEGNVPDDVSLQVLVQCRPELITRTFEALKGATNPIVHFYNSTSELQRRVVFEKDVAGIKRIATDAAKMITDMAAKAGGGYRFEYSPESFTGTELEVALEICNAVTEIVKPTADNKLIINLPSTVEMSTPNIYADRIEWMCRNLDNRENLIISLHPHNDRGTGSRHHRTRPDGRRRPRRRHAVRQWRAHRQCRHRHAGAQHVHAGRRSRAGLLRHQPDEGRLRIFEPAEDCRASPLCRRAGLHGLFRLAPGRHQQGHEGAASKANKPHWEVPYLPIDPADVGRSYEAIIRINSQSGKGGIAYVLQADYGLNLPRNLQVEFSQDIQAITDAEGKEVPAKRIYERFLETYVDQPGARLKFLDHQTYPDTGTKGRRVVEAVILDGGMEMTITGSGTGPIDGFVDALSRHVGVPMSVLDYSEHSMQRGSNASAISYVEMEYPSGKLFGAGINTNIVAASLEAVVSVANRIISRKAG